MIDKKIAVIGGDSRLAYLAEELVWDGYTVSLHANRGIGGEALKDKKLNSESSLEKALENAAVAVLPFPISPDGVYLNTQSGENIRLSCLFEKIREKNIKKIFGGAISPAVHKAAEEKGLTLYDYGKMETVALKNALCTAEGAIGIAIERLPLTLHSSEICVLGYGRIGRILATLLKGLGARVRAVARKPEDIAKMQIDGVNPFYFSELNTALDGSVLIYNTVPFPVLDRRTLSSLKDRPLIIDLASAPGGVDGDAAGSLGFKVIWALSLPGKTAPKSAAKIIKEAVLSK